MSESGQAPFDPVDLLGANKIDNLCDAFEAAWCAGSRPRIEDYLKDTAVPHRSTLLLELVKLDVYYRLRHGDTPRLDEYARRFPEHVSHLSDADLAETLNVRSATEAAPPREGRFEWIAKLGVGAFGTVWKARDKRLHRIVALKIPNTGPLEDAITEFLLREARAVAQLRHPNIVSIHEIGYEDGVWIASDFIDGPNLKDWLKEHNPDFKTIARLCLKLADALQHAHSRGIIHRDLKPANIILDGAGQPHITDFGLAKRLAAEGSISVDGQILGTPAYMSPEQAAGRSRDVDARSDVYSLGIILYELLSGKRPFAGDEPAVLRQVLSEQPAPPSTIRIEVPCELETICLKAIAKQPAQRYTTAQQFAADLRRYLEGQPVKARRPRLEEGRWSRRRFSAAAVAAPLLGYWAWNSLSVWSSRGGSQVVALDTQPSGATVWFIPLNKSTGEPQPEQAVNAGASPVEIHLNPGEYLVEAVIDEQRFHEVYRHVPSPEERVPPAYRHRHWRTEGRRVVLRTIDIPMDRSIVEEMALMEGSPSFRMGSTRRPDLPPHTRSVPSFHIDLCETTVGQYQAAYPKLILDRVPSIEQLDDTSPVRLRWDEAVGLAEKMGKRLPDEAEWEYAATAVGTLRYSWGNGDRSIFPELFGPVGTPEFDQLGADEGKLIRCMCSNVAEWTSTWAIPYPVFRDAGIPNPVAAVDWRIVRGGGRETIAGNPEVTPDERDPRIRTPVLRYELCPGVGFRCSRSTKPRLTVDDFPRVRA